MRSPSLRFSTNFAPDKVDKDEEVAEKIKRRRQLWPLTVLFDDNKALEVEVFLSLVFNSGVRRTIYQINIQILIGLKE